MESLVRYLRRAKLILTFGHEIGVWKQWGGRPQGCVQGTSAVSSRMKEIEGVGTVYLVYLGELLRMGSDCLLEMDSLAKGNQMCGWSGQVPDDQGTSMGAE